mgnify:CR=1 FL=1
MKTVALLLLALTGCASSTDTVDCTSWYDACSCAYVCGTSDQKAESDLMLCDVVCDTASMEAVPGGSCEDVEGSCEWVDE